jgi:hypothetical protein
MIPIINDGNLFEYFDPQVVFDSISAIMKDIPSVDFFNSSDPTYKYYRELWVASLFGQGLLTQTTPVEVALAQEETPDFFLKKLNDDQVYEFEITEVLEPGYIRGRYYIEMENSDDKVRQKDILNIDLVPSLISKRIEAKFNRLSPPRPNLLVLLNVMMFEQLDLSRVREECNEFRDAFPSIWLFRDGIFAKLFGDSVFQCIGDDWIQIPGRTID